MTTHPAAPLSTIKRSEWLLLGVVLGVTWLAYQPAWHGGFLWDDDHHITPAALQSLGGLGRIWFDMGATLQYYPLLHSVFWVLHRMLGDQMLGYHLVNLAVHSLAVTMLFVTLRRLAMPGALFAVALFALHPVQVESVAWITELKNTLSTVFYLGAALLYLRFDRTRNPRAYAAAFLVLALALLTKTVAGMLPFGLLVVLWWHRGGISWRRDVVPLAPMAAAGICMGLVTAWWELEFNRTGTAAFSLSLAERFLIAGRATWHQLASLAWPVNLLFSYPRWDLNAAASWQYVYPIGALAVLVAGWAVRHRTRAPLAALLFFGVTLAPTLGVFNLYTFRYSFVADHYQYVACIGIFALIAAAAATALQRLPRWAAFAGATTVLIVLTSLTWRQSANYASAEASYRAILAGHPQSWFAHANLGATLLHSSPEEAIGHLQKAIELKPDLAEAHSTLAMAYLNGGRLKDAADEAARALVFDARLPGARRTLADAFRVQGRYDEAVREYRAVIAMRLEDADAHDGLGLALAALGRHADATAEHRRAIEIDPARGQSFYFLGSVLQQQGQLPGAIAAFERGLPLAPQSADLRNNLAVALEQAGRTSDAERYYKEALALDPALSDASFNLATLLARTRREAESVPYFQAVLAREPGADDIRLHLGIVLIQLGRRAQAIAELQQVVVREPENADARKNLQRALSLPNDR